MTSVSWADLGDLPPASGRLLVATPLLGDPNFRRSVVFLLEHDGGGSVGVIVNRPSRTPVGHVLPNWQDAVSGPAVVFSGGPVQPDGALCLGQCPSGMSGTSGAAGTSGSWEGAAADSSAGTDRAGVRPVVDGVATVDLDGDVAVITGLTQRLRVFAGHAGWAPGQLDDEIAEGAWWVVPGAAGDVFSDAPAVSWASVLRRQPHPLNLLSTYPDDPSLN